MQVKNKKRGFFDRLMESLLIPGLLFAAVAVAIGLALLEAPFVVAASAFFLLGAFCVVAGVLSFLED